MNLCPLPLTNVVCAIASQVFLLSLLDLPFSISPVVTGLMLTLLYGRNGWFGPFLQTIGFNVVFAFTGEGGKR